MMDETTQKLLDLFIWKAEKLSNQNFIKHLKEQGGIEHTLTISDDEGIHSHHTGPNTDAIEAAAATFRLFIQKNEQVSFRAMSKLLQNPHISEKWKTDFTRTRDAVNDVLNETIPFVSDGEPSTRGYIVDIFLNGGIFHTEPGKVETFRAWQADLLYYPAVEFEFIATIAEIMRAIFHVADLCREELAAAGGAR